MKLLARSQCVLGDVLIFANPSLVNNFTHRSLSQQLSTVTSEVSRDGSLQDDKLHALTSTISTSNV